MEWVTENWKLISMVAMALWAMLERKFGNAKGASSDLQADELERGRTVGASVEDVIDRIKGQAVNHLVGSARAALSDSAARADQKPERKPRGKVKAVLQTVGQAVAENLLVSAIGGLFRRRS